MDRKLLTPQELADALSVPVTWIYDNSRPGNPRLPVIKLGPKLSRFNLAHVLRALGVQE